jgi:mannose-6-phosphate isomerase
MHLFEAALAIAAAPGARPDDLARADGLARWCADDIVGPHGALPELFDQAWRAHRVDDAFTVEPGHHFEWAWLLGELRALGGTDHRALAARLWAFARQHGIDPARGVAIDAIDSTGRVLAPTARLWPQTERLKAALAVAEDEAVAAFDGLQRFLETPAPGAVFDRMLPDGSFVAEPARASSLYHIVCAYRALVDAAERSV